MFRAFQVYVSQERHHVARGVPVNALSVGYDVDVIEFLKHARARRVHRAHHGAPEMRQLLENVYTLGRGDLIQPPGKEKKEILFCDAFAMTVCLPRVVVFPRATPSSLKAHDYDFTISKVRKRCVKTFAASKYLIYRTFTIKYFSFMRVSVYLRFAPLSGVSS